MPPTPRAKLSPSYGEIHLRLSPDTKFEDIVRTLQETLTLPKLPGFRGCQPCLSGLDRFVIENPALRQIR